jgi:hypothetical protein
LNTGVVKVWLKKLKFFVKKVRHTDRDETVPFRQPVIHCRVDCPKLVFGRLSKRCCESKKLAALIVVGGRKGSAPSGGVKQIEAHGNSMGI